MERPDQPRRPDAVACTVTMSWMPATTPTWVITCWRGAGDAEVVVVDRVATLAATDGDETPRPMPDRTRAPMITQVARAGVEGSEDHHRAR